MRSRARRKSCSYWLKIYILSSPAQAHQHKHHAIDLNLSAVFSSLGQYLCPSNSTPFHLAIGPNSPTPSPYTKRSGCKNCLPHPFGFSILVRWPGATGSIPSPSRHRQISDPLPLPSNSTSIIMAWWPILTIILHYLHSYPMTRNAIRRWRSTFRRLCKVQIHWFG